MFKSLCAAAVGLASIAFAPAAHAVPVDLELQLLVDVSGSVNSNEFALQAQGYADAFRTAEVQNAISNGQIGSIAVQLVFWSGASQQSVAIDWVQLSTASDANSFADAILAAGRPFSGGTAIGNAIDFGVAQFANDFEGTRNVIDVSGDGTANRARTAASRDAALAGGIDTINGIAIGSESVRQFYEDNVIGGIGAFVLLASTFEDFDAAIRQKLLVEITAGNEVPLPGAVLFLVTGAAGIASLRRRAAA